MEERPATLDRSSRPMVQMDIAFLPQEKLGLDPKMRAEVVALLGRLLLEAARRDTADEVRDDAP